VVVRAFDWGLNKGADGTILSLSSPSLFVSFNMAWPFAKTPPRLGRTKHLAEPTRQLAWALIARQKSVHRVAALRPDSRQYEMHYSDGAISIDREWPQLHLSSGKPPV
jgi:hypothetical protein